MERLALTPGELSLSIPSASDHPQSPMRYDDFRTAAATWGADGAWLEWGRVGLNVEDELNGGGSFQLGY